MSKEFEDKLAKVPDKLQRTTLKLKEANTPQY